MAGLRQEQRLPPAAHIAAEQVLACPLMGGIDPSDAKGMLITASESWLKFFESKLAAMPSGTLNMLATISVVAGYLELNAARPPCALLSIWVPPSCKNRAHVFFCDSLKAFKSQD